MSEGGAPRRPEWVGHPPAALTTLIGRDSESAAVGALLRRPDVRIVTLTGPGGVGKSRLAVRVAAETQSDVDTIAFVPLAAVRDPGLVAVTIAGALGITAPPPVPDLEAADALRAHLRSRSVLLLLDNFEHVLDAGTLLADLLSACPGVVALVTSRARLRVSGEHVVAVAPLALPGPGEVRAADGDRYDAVRLFVERARPCALDLSCPTTTWAMWSRPAAASTVCHWRSSSRPPGRRCCRRRRCWPAWNAGCPC